MTPSRRQHLGRRICSELDGMPRTMSDVELFGITLLLGLLAAPMIAVLSFLVASPFARWPL